MYRILYLSLAMLSVSYVGGCITTGPVRSPSKASLLQHVIGSPGSTEGEVWRAYDALADVSPEEDPGVWIFQAGDKNLSSVARGLSFQAFWCRFVRTPIGLRSLVRQYHLENLLGTSHLIDVNRTDTNPFDNMTVPNGQLCGLCIWCAPNGSDEHEFGVYLKLLRAVTPQQLIRIVTDPNIHEDIFIMEFSTLSGCPNPRKDNEDPK
jgi:hypothetical protein